MGKPSRILELNPLDAAVLATPGIARYCSGADWTAAAHRYLHAPREIFELAEGPHRLHLADGPLFEGLQAMQSVEAAWGFACPLLGPDPREAVSLFEPVGRRAWERGRFWFLCGLPSDGPYLSLLRGRFRREGRLRMIEAHRCVRASLDGGWDGFLSRRSGRFRQRLRRGEQSARAAGIEFQVLSPRTPGEADSAFRRILNMDTRSWKARAGESVFSESSHRDFYHDLSLRAAVRGGLRVLFLRQGERDIAYVFGGILAGEYRGFQIGFDEAFAAHGPGNLAQAALIRSLCGEGVTLYDLGMEMPYKRSWGEETLSLSCVLGLPR